MAFLKRDEPVVVDTHVIVRAAKQIRDDADGVEAKFMKTLLDRCPRIWISRTQWDAERNRGEIAERLRVAGFRPWYLSSLILRLDSKKKIVHLRSSADQPLASDVHSTFRGRGGHDDVTDDEHLYSVASSQKTVVVTGDQNLLRRAGDLEKATGVVTLSPQDAVTRWESEE
jgi:hypothetical protein